MAEVALITCYNAAGFLLLGKRRDSGAWTIPGGHLEEGEDPHMGALRELHEETGIRPISLSFLKESTNPDGLKLYCFSAYVGNAQPHSANDPDQEVASEDWKFYDVSAGLPAKIYENLHGPKSADDGNLIMQLFDLKKSARDTMGEDLEKGYAARALPFNPIKDVSPEKRASVFEWQNNQQGRSEVPEMAGPERQRALMRLAAATSVRKNAAGEHEFLLHRGGSTAEHNAATEVPGMVSHAAMSSWTPSHRTAKNFAYQYQSKDPGYNHAKDNKVMSAWVKASDIHSIPMHYGAVHPGSSPQANDYHFEHEVVVKPHTSTAAAPEHVAAVTDPKLNTDSRITARGKSGMGASFEQGTMKQVYGPRLGKAEEDEIHRLLSNPDVNERLMALKLNTCTPIHLQVASLDPDSQVHEAAINHSKFGDDQATHLMQASQDLDGQYPLAQQAALLARHDFVQPHHMAAMARTSVGQPQNYRDAVAAFLANHPLAPDGVLRTLYLDPALNQDSRMAILGHPNAPDDALLHAFHTGMMTPEASTAAKVAAQHPRMPSHALESVVKLAIDRPGSHVLPLAEHILLTTPTSKEIQNQIFLACTLNADRLDARALLMAMLKGPSATSQMTARAMKELPPEVWGQAEPKEFGPEHLEQILHGSELKKSIDPAHLASVARASTSAGANLVDHTPDLHAHPPEIDHAVKAFHEQVLNSPKKTPGLTDKQAGLDKGVSKKKVFKAQVPGRPEPQKYLVKPYHEALTRHDKDYMKHPHQGWSELTNQALYHAGGIGHLHQQVHVSELNMGPGHEQEPAVVVHIKPNQTSVHEYGGRHYDNPDVERGMPLRQIAIMDMLSNNQDRHNQNMTLDGSTQQPLAIDHGRSFQYIAPNRRGDSSQETFGSYVKNTAIGQLEALHDRSKMGKSLHDMHMDTMNRYAPAFDWWGEAGPKIRQAFHDRLGQIKDPDVRAHLKRNFDTRADWLDERAKMGLENYGLDDWHRDPIPMYKPGELTDEEQSDPELRAEVEKRQADKKAIAKAAKKKAVDSKVAYRQWLAEKPEYPKHLKALPREQQAVHPDFLKYSKESDKWFKRRPEEG